MVDSFFDGRFIRNIDILLDQHYFRNVMFMNYHVNSFPNRNQLHRDKIGVPWKSSFPHRIQSNLPSNKLFQDEFKLPRWILRGRIVEVFYICKSHFKVSIN